MPAPNPKQKPKFYPVGGRWRDDLKDAGQRIMKLLFGVSIDWAKQKDIARNHFELGVINLRDGHFGDAVFRFRLVTWLNPAHAEGWYYLGRSYLATGKRDKAVMALRKSLSLSPGHAEASYMLAVALGKAGPDASLPTTMPIRLAQEHFDTLAGNYDIDQVEVRGYKGHSQLAEAVRETVTPGRIDHVILDLGAGSGLCGRELRTIASHITGVDVAPKMAEQTMKLTAASGHKVYDATVARDLQAYLEEAAPESFDIVTAGAVIGYVGDLTSLFPLVAKVLKPGGIFALTADKVDGEGYRFDPKMGRFRFSSSYIAGLASAQGFSQLKCETVPAYPNNPMWICVFRK